MDMDAENEICHRQRIFGKELHCIFQLWQRLDQVVAEMYRLSVPTTAL
jgi:hypothetical protein